MKIKYESIEPIEERPANHKLHIVDNDNSFSKDKSNQLIAVRGEHNVFPLIKFGNGVCTLLRPSKEKIRDDITQIVSQLKEDNVLVNLYGFPLTETQKYFNIRAGEHSFPINWYQTLLPVETYNKKLKRFRNKGLEFGILSEEDIPQLKELIRNWSKLKKDTALSTFNLDKIKSPRDISTAISKLQSLQTEVEWMDFKEREEDHYKDKMKEPITSFYGAFQDGQLVAYSEVQANSNFASFETRGSIRRNSFSPQEFVDYNIMKKLAEDGVKIIERGPLHMRKGASGLMEYKKKFGPLKIYREVNLSNVSIVNDPLFDMAKEKQGNPFE